jgi:hypothetical protein
VADLRSLWRLRHALDVDRIVGDVVQLFFGFEEEVVVIRRVGVE